MANFDKCIREARGDYLVIACDDNVLDPEFLERCVRLVRLEPGIPIVLAAYSVLVVNEFSKNDRRSIRGEDQQRIIDWSVEWDRDTARVSERKDIGRNCSAA